MNNRKIGLVGFILATLAHSVVLADDTTQCVTDILMKSSNGDPGNVSQYQKLAYWKADNGGTRSANKDHTNWSHNHSHIGLYVKYTHTKNLNDCIGDVFLHTTNSGWGSNYAKKKNFSAVDAMGKTWQGTLEGVWDADGGGAYSRTLDQKGHYATYLYSVPYNATDKKILTSMYAHQGGSKIYSRPAYALVGYWDDKGGHGYSNGASNSKGDWNLTLLKSGIGESTSGLQILSEGDWIPVGNPSNYGIETSVHIAEEYAKDWSMETTATVSASYEAFGVGMSAEVTSGFSQASSSSNSSSYSATANCSFKCGDGINCDKAIWQYKMTTKNALSSDMISYATMCTWACTKGSDKPNFTPEDSDWAKKASDSCK